MENQKRLIDKFIGWILKMLFSLLLLFPVALIAGDDTISDLSPEAADLLVNGDFKKAVGIVPNEELKNNISKLLNMNQLVADAYKMDIGKEISIPIRGKNEKGILTKVKGEILYVKVDKGAVIATWPVKVKTLPVEFRMERIAIPKYVKNLYFGAKAFRQKNYSAAIYYFKHTDTFSTSLMEAADKESKYIISFSTACLKGDLETAGELLKKGADANGELFAYIKNKKTGKIEKKRSTILIEIIKHHQQDVIKYLIKNGADINKPNSNGVTPLMFAIMYFPQKLEIVEFLLNHQADFNKTDKKGNTALTGAVGAGRAEAMKLLIKYGADVNARNQKGYTPIMIAVASNNAAMFKQLLENGADIKKPHPKGWSVFDFNREKMHPAIRAVLDSLSPVKDQIPNTLVFPDISIGM